MLDRRRGHLQVYAYVGREFLLSFFVAFLFFFFIFFVNQMLLLAEEILTKRVRLIYVIRLIIYALPSIVALCFPFGSLVGALMTVGRLSSDNEIVAFKASGIPLRKVFYPLLVLGVVFSGVSFVMNDYFLPLGTINYGKLYRELVYANPELELESNTVKNYQDRILITGDVSGRRIEDLVILDRNPEDDSRVITAGSASLVASEEQQGVISLELDSVFSQSIPEGTRGEYDYFTAGAMVYNILLKDISFAIRNPGPREMSSVDVYREIEEREAQLAIREADRRSDIEEASFRLYQSYLTSLEQDADLPALREELKPSLEDVRAQKENQLFDRTLQIYWIEYFKKFSIPFACLVFVVFAFPVGLFTKRSGRAVGFGIGLLVSVLYWSMLIAGQTVGMQRQEISPFLSMWGPNFVVLLIGVVLFGVRFRK